MQSALVAERSHACRALLRQVAGGQGTIALELLADLERVDAIFVPVGSGGLISGIAGDARRACACQTCFVESLDQREACATLCSLAAEAGCLESRVRPPRACACRTCLCHSAALLRAMGMKQEDEHNECARGKCWCIMTPGVILHLR